MSAKNLRLSIYEMENKDNKRYEKHIVDMNSLFNFMDHVSKSMEHDCKMITECVLKLSNEFDYKIIKLSGMKINQVKEINRDLKEILNDVNKRVDLGDIIKELNIIKKYSLGQKPIVQVKEKSKIEMYGYVPENMKGTIKKMDQEDEPHLIKPSDI